MVAIRCNVAQTTAPQTTQTTQTDTAALKAGIDLPRLVARP